MVSGPLKTLLLRGPVRALSWLGRQGTRAVAALVILGVAFPWIGATVKPYVSEAVFALLCIAFLRVDGAGLKRCIRRPLIIVAATAWTSLVVPLLFGAGCLAMGLDRQNPGLFLGVMLQGIASPMMAAPAIAALLGLDATLTLVTVLAGTALIPLTAPLFALVFVGPVLTVAPILLAAKLFGIIALSALAGYAGRRVFGLPAIERQANRIDGINILILFVFVAALMGQVGRRLLTAPVLTLALTGLSFLVFFALLFVTGLLFLPAGRGRALALAFVVSQRNMGLMLAATGGALPDLSWLYFGLSQFPIYLSPHLLQSLVRRIIGRGETPLPGPPSARDWRP